MSNRWSPPCAKSCSIEILEEPNKYLNNFLYTLDNWNDCILSYFTHRFTTSIVEGINNPIKKVKHMGYGFRNFANFKQRVLMYFA